MDRAISGAVWPPMARPMGAWSPSTPHGVGPGLGELTPDEGRAAPAAQHTDVGRSFFAYLREAFHVEGVGTGSYDKVGLRAALHPSERLRVGAAEHRFRPRAAEGVGVVGALLQPGDRQAQHDGQPDDALGHMASAAEDKPGRTAELFHEDTHALQRQEAAGSAPGQCREIPGQQSLGLRGPDRHTLTEQKPLPLLGAFQHRCQNMLALRGTQRLCKLTNRHRTSPYGVLLHDRRCGVVACTVQPGVSKPPSPPAASASRGRSPP